MRFGRFLLPAVLALCTLQPSSVFAAPEEAWVPRESRKAAPTLSLRDLEGKRRQLSELTGKIVVVNFWATWCGPCRTEMPEFTAVHAAYRDKGVEFIGAANEPRSAKDKVQEFVASLKIEFPIWLEASADHMEAFGVGAGLPATVIVDQQGRVAARIKGVTHGEQLRSLLDRLLSEATPSPGR
jgi:thiol-disulfide isomerase/thioredoxin